jgi:hypothetical protein
MSTNISVKEIEERIYKKHGDNISMKDYKGVHKPANFYCNVCGNNWVTSPVSVYSSGCKKCATIANAEKYRLKIDDVKKYIEENNCTLLSTEYINTGTKLDILFECGHNGKISFECFKRGQRCAICSKKKMGLSQRIPMEDLLKILQERKIKFIEFPNGYENRNSTIKCICEYGHIEEHKISVILNGTGCSECRLIYSSISQRGELGYNWQGGLSSLTSFLKKQIKQWKKDSIKNCNYHCVICGEGHRFNDVHHLYSFFSIMNESLSELNIENKILVSDFTDEELFLLTNKVIEEHNEHPLGVCLCRKHHKLFHKYFGIYNNTPSQFEEFKQIVASEQQILS